MWLFYDGKKIEIYVDVDLYNTPVSRLILINEFQYSDFAEKGLGP